jgi:hypothetical protein
MTTTFPDRWWKRALRVLGLLMIAFALVVPVLWATGSLDGFFAGWSCRQGGTLGYEYTCSPGEAKVATVLLTGTIALLGFLSWFLPGRHLWAWTQRQATRPVRQPRVIDLSGRSWGRRSGSGPRS